MIKKLKKRVRLLIQIPLFLLITLISAAFLYLNYTGIMRSANDTLNRFSVVSNDGEEGMPAQGNMTEPEKKEPNGNAPEKPKGDGKPKPKYDFFGVGRMDHMYRRAEEEARIPEGYHIDLRSKDKKTPW